MNLALREKIIALFEYRQLPELITFGGRELDQEFYEKLIDLQYQIYKLDHELESNWDVDMGIIDDRWQKIYQSLLALNIPVEAHDRYCRHIYKYQRHELDIRLGKLPTRLSMEYFYFYKSCDVKLLRKIIYQNNTNLSNTLKESNWRLFDLVTEINDDIVDLQEDISTINGNRFLISLKQFGKAETKKVFSEFLKEIEARNQQQDISFSNIDLTNWTKTQVDDTLDLLKIQIDKFESLDTSLYDQLVVSKLSVKGSINIT